MASDKEPKKQLIYYLNLVYLDKKFNEMNSNEIRNRITSSIHSKDPNAEAFLFGSRARGDNRPDSDWDILILVENDKVTNEIEDNFRDDLFNIEIDSGQVITTFIYPKRYWNTKLIYSPLYENIKSEGIKL